MFTFMFIAKIFNRLLFTLLFKFHFIKTIIQFKKAGQTKEDWLFYLSEYWIYTNIHTCISHFSYANIISVCVSQIKWFEITVIAIIQSNNHFNYTFRLTSSKFIDPYTLKIVSLRYNTQLNCVVFGDSFCVRV